MAGGSNPPGRAMERSGGYMHARVYPPFFIPHNRSGHSLVADFQTLLLGHGPHMRMEGTRKIYLEFLSVLLGYQLFITDIYPKRQIIYLYVKIVFIPYTNFKNFYFTRNSLPPCSSIRYSRSLLSTSTPPAATAIITHVAAVVGPSIAAAAVADIAATAVFLISPSSFVTI